MTVLSDAQLWSVIQSQWGTGSDALKAFAIALAESGGDPAVVSKPNANGTVDYGLMQINSSHKALLANGNWQDPTSNANMGYQLYVAAGNKFTPWTTYNDGAYAQHLARAQAAEKAGGSPVPSDSTSVPGTADGTDPVAASEVANATSGNTWLRIGEFLAGAILIAIVLVAMFKNTSIGKAATQVAVEAAMA